MVNDFLLLTSRPNILFLILLVYIYLVEIVLLPDAK